MGKHKKKDSKIELYQYQIDIMINLVTKVGTAMLQVSSILFVMLVAIISWYFSKYSNSEVKKVIYWSLIIIIPSFLIIMLSMAWGVLTGIKQIQNSLEIHSKKVFKHLQVNTFFRRGYFVSIFVVLFCTLMLLSMGIFLIFYRDIIHLLP